jgi:inner membrane protein
MLWKTHFFTGAAAGFWVMGHADIKTAVISAGIAGVSALVPDLDDPDSIIGRTFPVISWITNKTIGHRGPLHSILGAGIFFVLILITLKFNFALLGLVGYLSHMIMDSLNPPGVPWLWPIKTHFRIPLIAVGGFMERLIVTPAMLMLCAYTALRSMGIAF